MFGALLESKLVNNSSLINVITKRNKSIIKPNHYREHAEFKKRDPRWNTATHHRPKLITWHDYQIRKWKADHYNNRFPAFQAKMDLAHNLCLLGMSTKSIEQITLLTPHVIDYYKRRLSGNIEVLRPAHYSNYVNSARGSYKK